MSEFWLKKMKKYFRMIDIDGDGIITKRDIEMFGELFLANEKLDRAGQERIRKHYSNLWECCSKLAGNDKSSVTEEEFIESIKYQRNDESLKSIIIEDCRCFVEAFDTNEDGFLQEDEYRRLLESMGLPNVASYAKMAFNAIDTNHDGKVSKDELTTAYLDFVLSEDEKSPFQFFFGPLE